MGLFTRRPKASTAPTTNGDGAAQALKAREAVFAALGSRVGKEYEDIIRADFRGHLEDDPIHGVDIAYACLVAKLVDIIDSLDDLVQGGGYGSRSTAKSTASGASPFTIQRKDDV